MVGHIVQERVGCLGLALVLATHRVQDLMRHVGAVLHTRRQRAHLAHGVAQHVRRQNTGRKMDDLERRRRRRRRKHGADRLPHHRLHRGETLVDGAPIAFGSARCGPAQTLAWVGGGWGNEQPCAGAAPALEFRRRMPTGVAQANSPAASSCTRAVSTDNAFSTGATLLPTA
eukprot:scaffold16790_cov101-Isochrysis_galbana.AAC.6